ncbi:hypothetical protein BH11ACT8_BH11ACT8_12230 [soil metagenome]
MARRSAEERDEQAQERAEGRVKPHRLAPAGYTHATHPATGLEVVFVAGEALPDWVKVDAQPDPGIVS